MDSAELQQNIIAREDSVAFAIVSRRIVKGWIKTSFVAVRGVLEPSFFDVVTFLGSFLTQINYTVSTTITLVLSK